MTTTKFNPIFVCKHLLIPGRVWWGVPCRNLEWYDWLCAGCLHAFSTGGGCGGYDLLRKVGVAWVNPMAIEEFQLRAKAVHLPVDYDDNTKTWTYQKTSST
jgi:hypothetical protein